ncbi:MAG: hypothetical protein JOY86_04170, partial [Candidatus Eremiobacteraeota bacterium]|nr:hypothetical protein [Candidatus Eremiobacteraeota bacterium]
MMDGSVQSLAQAQAIAPDLWTTLRGVFRLDPHAFTASLALKDAPLVAAAIVLLAALSETVGQSVVLFANRIKPGRFVFSLLVSALLFAFGYVFLTLSTWAITLLPLATKVSLRSLAIVYAFSYAPLVLGFFEAVPYLGVAIGWFLRIWFLLASLVGVAAVGHLALPDAVLYVGLGWLVTVVGRQTVGRPLARLTQWIMSAVAGVTFESDESKAISGAQSAKPEENAESVVGSATLPPASAATARSNHPWTSRWQVIATALGFIVVAVITAVAIKPLQNVLFGWTGHLPGPLRLPF